MRVLVRGTGVCLIGSRVRGLGLGLPFMGGDGIGDG